MKRTPNVLDATRIDRGLYVGSAPFPGRYSGVDVIVLASSEYQPADYEFPGIRVRHFPFHDTSHPSRTDFMTAWAAASTVADDVAAGKSVLVTCNLGRNRSALVATIALHMLRGISGKEAMKIVRSKRIDPLGVRALSNDAFRAFLAKIR